MSENKNMREVSMEEMNKVSGGADGVYVKGNYVTERQVYDTAMALLDTWGYDIATDMFCTNFGLSKHEIPSQRHDRSDKDNMEILVNRLMKIYDNIEDKGYSY